MHLLYIVICFKLSSECYCKDRSWLYVFLDDTLL